VNIAKLQKTDVPMAGKWGIEREFSPILTFSPSLSVLPFVFFHAARRQRLPLENDGSQETK